MIAPRLHSHHTFEHTTLVNSILVQQLFEYILENGISLGYVYTKKKIHHPKTM